MKGSSTSSKGSSSSKGSRSAAAVDHAHEKWVRERDAARKARMADSGIFKTTSKPTNSEASKDVDKFIAHLERTRARKAEDAAHRMGVVKLPFVVLETDSSNPALVEACRLHNTVYQATLRSLPQSGAIKAFLKDRKDLLMEAWNEYQE